MKHIKVRGARQHNLKNIDIDLPRDKLVVIQVSLVQVNQVWLSIHCMQKGKEDM